MDQRQNTRFKVEASAIMRVQGVPGPFLVTILDVSTSGLRISSSGAFPSGTGVTLTFRKTEMRGQIRYSRPFGGQSHLGVQVDIVTGSLAQAENGEVDLLRLFDEQIQEKRTVGRS
jgi:hypothetical protein